MIESLRGSRASRRWRPTGRTARRHASARAGRRPSAGPASSVWRQAMNTTIVQPRPMSSRLAPVMLASARAQSDSRPAAASAGAGRRAPNSLYASPPLRAKTRSTAYSGQDRDERQDGDGQAGGDVELGHLGGPGQEEGRADDGQAEDQGQERVGQVGGGPGRGSIPEIVTADRGCHDGVLTSLRGRRSGAASDMGRGILGWLHALEFRSSAGGDPGWLGHRYMVVCAPVAGSAGGAGAHRRLRRRRGGAAQGRRPARRRAGGPAGAQRQPHDRAQRRRSTGSRTAAGPGPATRSGAAGDRPPAPTTRALRSSSRGTGSGRALRRRPRPGHRRADLALGAARRRHRLDRRRLLALRRPAPAPWSGAVNWRGFTVLFSDGATPRGQAGTRHFFTWVYQVDDPAHPAPDPGATGPRSRPPAGVSVGATVPGAPGAPTARALELFDEPPGGPPVRRPDPRGRDVRVGDRPRPGAGSSGRSSAAAAAGNEPGRPLDQGMDPAAALDRIAYLLETGPAADLPGPGLPRRRPRSSAELPARRSGGAGRPPADCRTCPASARRPRRSSSRRWRGDPGLPAGSWRRSTRRTWRAAASRRSQARPPSCGPRCGATATRTPTGPTAGRPIDEMARAARDLGHEYIVLTDHSRQPQGGQGPVGRAAPGAARRRGRPSTRRWPRSGS